MELAWSKMGHGTWDAGWYLAGATLILRLWHFKLYCKQDEMMLDA
jgi:hypothetical protein